MPTAAHKIPSFCHESRKINSPLNHLRCADTHHCLAEVPGDIVKCCSCVPCHTFASPWRVFPFVLISLTWLLSFLFITLIDTPEPSFYYPAANTLSVLFKRDAPRYQGDAAQTLSHTRSSAPVASWNCKAPLLQQKPVTSALHLAYHGRFQLSTWEATPRNKFLEKAAA